MHQQHLKRRESQVEALTAVKEENWNRPRNGKILST